ncbi:MAG: hypothetical protein AB1508_01855 [Pseudomonadota bacterium]
MEDDIRPSTRWRDAKRQEAEDLANGRIAADECYMLQLFPDDFIAKTEAVLDAYSAAIAKLPTTADAYPDVMAQIKTAVVALNDINEAGDRDLIETDEREDLCAFLEQVIIRHGIDIDALAKSQNVGRHELTDRWREW